MVKRNFLLGILFLGILLGPASFSSAQTNVSGAISQNTTWTLTGSPYIVIGDVTVNGGITLTIQPGVEVKFAGNYSLTVNGALNAVGTATQRIRFTSNQASPMRGDWRGIVLVNASTTLDYLQVEYSNYGIDVQLGPVLIQNSIFSNNNRGVNTAGDNLSTQRTIQGSTFQNNTYGIFANNSTLTVVNGTITNNVNGAFFYCTDIQLCVVQMNNNSILGNTSYNVNANHNGSENASGIRINAENNWWGTTDPIAIAAGIYDYQEATGLPTVDFIPYLDAPNGNPIGHNNLYGALSGTLALSQSPYLAIGHLLVPVGQTLTIQPGVEIRFVGNYFCRIRGTLNAAGTATQMIKFTSNQTTPARGDWRGILISEASTTLDYLQIEYANYGIHVQSLIPIAIRNSIFLNNNRGVYAEWTSPQATIQTSTFQNNQYGFFINNTKLTVTNSTISNNTYGAGINCGTVQDCVVHINSNVLLGNTGYNIQTIYGGGPASTASIDAENNWWGTTDPVAIAASVYDYYDLSILPRIDFDPYLFSANGQPLVTNVSISSLSFNPFINQTLSFNYTLGIASNVTIRIYDYDTHNLVRTLINNLSKPAGPNTDVWDGKDDNAQFLPPSAYYFLIEAVTAQGVRGGYSPVYWPVTVPITNGNLSVPNFDPYKGDTVLINYTPSSPAFLTIKTGGITASAPSKTLVNNRPRISGAISEVWDARDDAGNIVGADSYVVFGWTTTLPPNAILIEYPTFKVDYVRTNPYVINTRYGEATEIKYRISQTASVTVTVEDPTNVIARTLVNSQQQAAGEYTVIWDGRDGQGRVVDGQGQYKVKVRATHPSGAFSTTLIGNITVFK